MSDDRKEPRRFQGPTASSVYTLTMGSVFASSALSVLISKNDTGWLWALFCGGLVAVIIGAIKGLQDRD